MKNYPHILSKVYGQPWCITKEKHAAIRQAIEMNLSGRREISLQEWDDEGGEEDDGREEIKQFGATQIIPVYGILGKHLSSFEMQCGGCSLDKLCELLNVADNDSSVEHILLDFDTPGGTVVGIPEAAKLIADIATRKEVTAFTESECCSAGMWLASQANQFYCTESSVIGSIGVYCIYIDQSRALEMDGVKVNAISEGEFKLSGASFKAMTDAEMAMFQERVSGVYKKFTAAVNSKRTIAPEIMQGQTFYGDEAVENGLCDALVDNIEELLGG